jgi:hypothetical protein
MPATRPKIPVDIQRQVLVAAGHRCAVCGDPCPLERAHIIPWHKSKSHAAENLICLCANCHERADLEGWGEKTLRCYRENPWVIKKLLPANPGRSRQAVTLKLNLSYDGFDPQKQRLFRYAVAGWLEVSPEDVTILAVEPGSVILTVAVPERVAGRLFNIGERDKNSILQAMSNIKVKSRKGEIMTKKCESGLDDRCRDVDGEIRQKRGDTLVRTLRKEYGEGFAPGVRSDTRLDTLRERAGGTSLSKIVKGKT